MPGKCIARDGRANLISSLAPGGENMKLKALLFLALAVAVTLYIALPGSAHAQGLYAAIHGTVTDSSGAVVPNASITVVNTSTNIRTTAKADSKGYYTVPQLQVGGPYSVTIAATGFTSFSSSGFTLNVNDDRGVDGRLTVGSGTTTVQVSTTSTVVETSDTQLKQLVTSQQLEEIPLFGRDPAGLQKLQPGVVESSDRFGNFSTNGSQTPQNAYSLDGVDINDGPLQNEGITVNPDALQEENVVSSTLNPEFARNSGATINEILKSGTNQFHGNAFEFYRDTFMNATPFFSQVRPQFHQNQYGGTIGGPVLRDRLFFFLGYQGLRNSVGQTNVSTTLTGTQLAGNFTDDPNFASGNPNSAGLTTNPIPFAIGNCPKGEPWNQCFPNGTVNIPPSQWSSISNNFIAKGLIPRANTGDNLYTFNTSDTNAQDQGVIRADYTLTARDSIWASSVFQSSPSATTLSFGGSSFPGFGSVQAEHFKIFAGHYTHTFSSSTLNELRATYYRFNFAAVEPATPALPSAYGFTGITPQNTSAPGAPYIGISGYFNLGNSFEGPQPRLDSNLTYGDNFTKIIGAHSLKFGASWEQFRVSNPFDFYNNGDFSFGGGGLYSSGDPVVDFLMGIPDGYNQSSNGFINAVATETYAYAQDSWKLSPDVTVNYGLAWDAEKPNQNHQFGGLGINCWTNTSTESTVFPGAPPGLSFPGDPGCNRAGGPTTRYNRFGPRLGFAWSPSSGPSFLIGSSGSHDFSIRGGYGLYYNRDQEEQSLQNLEDPPFLLFSRGSGQVGGSPAFASPFNDITGNASVSIPNQFPYAIPTAGNTNIDWQDLYNLLELSTFDNQRYTVPYAQNFNLNIQRSLPSNMILQVGYVGSLGRRLPSWYDGQSITPSGHAACAAGAVAAGVGACNSAALRGSIRTYFPQFAADSQIVPGTGGGAVPSLPNGIPWYTSVARQTTENASSYNSLQISLIKSPTHGLYTGVSYTYSHALDNGSGYESFTGTGAQQTAGHVQIYTPGFTYLNYGDSDFDARHRLVVSYIYSVPVFAMFSNNLFMREALSGWEVAGYTAVQTGYPITVSQGQTRSLWCDGDSYFGCGDVPNTSNFKIKSQNPRNVQSLNGTSARYWFDPSSFSDEPLGTYGNVKRNFFHGPGFNYTNMQVSKNIPFGRNESRYLQLRAEGANVFNHANFAPPSGSFTDPTFGQVNQLISPTDPNGDPAPGREFQLVVKVFF